MTDVTSQPTDAETIAALRARVTELEAALAAGGGAAGDAEREERLRLALEAADLGTWDWDLQANSAWASPRHAASFGLPPAPLYDMTALAARLDPADRERMRAYLELVRGGRVPPGRFDEEVTAHLPDGGRRRIALHGRCLRGADGRPARLIGVSRDLTAHQRDLDGARAEGDLLRRVLAACPHALAYVDRDERYRFVNERYAGWIGLPPDAVLGQRPVDVLRDQWEDQNAEGMQRALAGEAVRFSRTFLREVEHVRELEVLYAPDVGPGGAVQGVTLVIDDVTERRAAERDVRQRAERLNMVAEANQDGYWDWDVASGDVFYSESWQRMLGYAPGELEPHLRAWEVLLHPDDVVQALRVVAEHLAGRTPQIETEHRLRTKQGEYRWFLSRGRVVARDEQGRPLRTCGTHTDLTERKHTESALRRSNRALRVLSAVNMALVRARGEEALLEEVCRALVGLGGYRLAWVGFAEDDPARTIRPVARAGVDAGWVDSLRLSWSEEPPGGRGPGGVAIRTGKTQLWSWRDDGDAALDALAPWRAQARARGFSAASALPLKIRGRAIGFLSVYGDHEETFDADEVRLLEELAQDMALGVEMARARAEREGIQASLRESEARLRSIFQHAPLGIAVLDEAGRVVDSNVALRAMLGYAPAELAGVPYERLVHPEEPVGAALQELVAGAQVTRQRERRMLRKAGDVFVGRVTASLVRRKGASGGALVVKMFEDLGPIRAAEARLERRACEQAALSALSVEALSSSSREQVDHRVPVVLTETTGADLAAVFSLSPDGRTLLLRSGQGWGTSGRGLTLAVTPGSFVARALAAEEGASLAFASFEGLPAPLREAGVAEGLLVPVRDGGAVIGALGLFSRVVDGLREAAPFLGAAANLMALSWRRWDAAAALERSNQLLAAAGDRAARDERLRALGQLASGIAHDFNNHLTPILGFTDLLLEGGAAVEDRAKLRRYLSMVKTAAQGAAGVVSRLREFYRKRDDHERAEPVDVNALVTTAMALAEPKWRDEAGAVGKVIRFDNRLEARRPIVGNQDELRDAVLNLILNAVDALPPRGGTLSLCTRDEPGGVVIEVGDDGCGMSDEVRRRCLEPFFSTKGEKGTGLGLPQVWGIVQRHGGDVDIRSRPGEGTTVVLTLPTGAPAEASPPPPMARVSRRLRVLVVDDEETSRALLRDALTLDGHEVVAAAGGAEGLTALSDGHFDLLITDRSMPDMSGDSVAVKARGYERDLPIVMLTGFGELMTPEGRPEGVDLVLAKPVTIGRLRQALAEALAMHEARGG